MRRIVAVLGCLALAGCGPAGALDNGAPGGPAASSGAPTVSADGVLRTAGCATATSPPAMSIDGTPQPANQNALSAVAGRVQPRAETDFAAVYAGVALVQERDRIQVYRKPSPEFDQWIRRDFAADCVEVLDARYSAVELAAFQQRVTSDFEYWRQRGLQINSVGASFIRGVVVVGTLEVDRARRELPARYGPQVPIEVERQGPIGW